MSKLLEKLNYPISNVSMANNGVDAIKLVQRNQYDVIFMDLLMPGIYLERNDIMILLI